MSLLLYILTAYTSGFFVTQAEQTSSASFAACAEVVDTLVYQLQTNPALLSDWAFAGVGKQEEKKRDAVFLVWKESEYDPERQYSKILFDVLVNGRRMFRDIAVESVVKDSVWEEYDDRDGVKQSTPCRRIRVDIYYSGSLLKEAYGELCLREKDGVRVQMETHVRFGWFFNLFISRKVYSETIEWRMDRFVQNLTLRAEGTMPSDAYWQEKDEKL